MDVPSNQRETRAKKMLAIERAGRSLRRERETGSREDATSSGAKKPKRPKGFLISPGFFGGGSKKKKRNEPESKHPEGKREKKRVAREKRDWRGVKAEGGDRRPSAG